MTDMRLIVVGAGGRMGRTLIRAIAETLAPSSWARWSAGARRFGRMPARLAGLPPNGVTVGRSIRAGRPCRRRARLHRARRDARLSRSPRRRGSSTSSAPPAVRPTTTRRSRRPRAMRAIVKSGNMSLGVNLLAVLVARRRRRRSTRTSTSRSSRCTTTTRSMRRRAPRCCSARRRPRGAASTSTTSRCACATAIPARAQAGDIGFATLARRHGGRRPHA